MQCSNCGEPYDLKNNTPYVLSCNHTVCKQCLKNANKVKWEFMCKFDGTVVPRELIAKLQKNSEIINRIKNRKAGGSPSTQNQFPVRMRMETMKAQKQKDIETSMNKSQSENIEQFRSDSTNTQALQNYQQQLQMQQQQAVSLFNGDYATQKTQDVLSNGNSPQMQQVRMDFQMSSLPVSLNANEEEKIQFKVDQSKSDQRSPTSLHNTYKSSILMQNQEKYKIIDELVDEESKSSIYNKTNGGDHSMRQSQVLTSNQVVPLGKGNLMTIVDQDTPKIGVGNKFFNSSSDVNQQSQRQSQRDRQAQIQATSVDQFNDERLETIHEQDISHQNDSYTQNYNKNYVLSIHQEDDQNRNDLIFSQKNLIDKTDINQSEGPINLGDIISPNAIIQLPFKGQQVSMTDIGSNIRISRNEPEMTLISKNFGDNNTQPAQFKIEIEHVSRVNSSSIPIPNNETIEEQKVHTNNMHSKLAQIHQTQSQEYSPGNYIDSGDESLVTDAMFKNSTTPSNDHLIYQNSIGNLTASENQNITQALHSRQENFESMNKNAQNAKQNYPNSQGSYQGSVSSNTQQVQNRDPSPQTSKQMNQNNDQLQQLSIPDEGFINNQSSLQPSSPTAVLKSHRDHNAANDIDEKFKIEQQLQHNHQIPDQQVNLQSQREIYHKNLHQLQSAQHDFQNEIKQIKPSHSHQISDEIYSNDMINLNTNNNLNGITETYEVDTPGQGGTNTNQDASKKKKKKGKKKKKRGSGVNMTSVIDESQYEYTIVQDDVSSEHNLAKSRKSMKNLKNLLLDQNQESTPQLGTKQQSKQDQQDEYQEQINDINQNDMQKFSNDNQNDVQLQQQDIVNSQKILDQILQNEEQFVNEFKPSLQSFDENRQSRHQSLKNLQYELNQIEQNFQTNPNYQTLSYVPPHMKSKKFRQQKVVSQEINSQMKVEPSVDSLALVKNISQIPSRIESAHSYNLIVQKPVIHVSPNINDKQSYVTQLRKIQDGIPPFNTSVGGQMRFQALNSKSQTQLPDINGRENSINRSHMQGQLQSVINQDFSKTTLPVRVAYNSGVNRSHQPEALEENKNEESADIHLRSQGNAPLYNNRLQNNNYMSSQNMPYYQNDNTQNTDMGTTTNYQMSPPYSSKPDRIDSDNFQNQKNNVNQFDSMNENFVSTPGSRASSKASLRNHTQNLTNVDPSLSPVPTQQGIIMPLQDKCKFHPRESIKYFCRDPACLIGLCPDCIIEHSKHDFLAANELAAFEIKQVVKQAQRRCKNQVKLQKDLKQQTEKKLSSLNRQRSDEFHRIHCYFNELHRELDERESQLNNMFNEEIRDIESQLMKDMQNIQLNYSDNVKIFKKLKMLIEQQCKQFIILYFNLEISQDTAVVGNAEFAYQLNNLTIQKEQIVQNKVFYVQFDENKHDIITPTYALDLATEKAKIQSIGRLIAANSDEDIIHPQQLINHSQRPSATFPTLIDAQNLIENLPNQNMSSLPQNNIKKSVYGKLRDAQTQTIDSDHSRFNSMSSNNQLNDHNSTDVMHTSNKNVYWFRWDTPEVYRLNPDTRKWQIRTDIKNLSKFLFFSSIVHLNNDMGCFILGGSDNENNFSKRVQYFCKYNVMVEKPPMINKRAFFPSIFSRLDNSIYALGGSENNQSDLNKCEKFSLIENVWRPVAPMNLSRNGMGAIIIEQYRLIFTFGGNNHKVGSLCKIEKYEIDFDKWTILSLQMKNSVHDLSAFCVGKERALLFGGHSNTEPNKEVEMIDLSFECFKSKQGKSHFQMKEGGKTYFPPLYDSNTGKVQLLFGYCDSQPAIEEIDIGDLVISSSSNIIQKSNQLQHNNPSLTQLNQNQSNSKRSNSQSKSIQHKGIEL
eukprot:403350962